MSESKHTAGPWVVFTPEDHEGQSDSRTLGIDSADGIAVVWHGDGPETGIPNDADARLIAAAPDLLAAGREALALLEGMGAGVNDKGYADLTAAIAAATGATP